MYPMLGFIRSKDAVVLSRGRKTIGTPDKAHTPLLATNISSKNRGVICSEKSIFLLCAFCVILLNLARLKSPLYLQKLLVGM